MGLTEACKTVVLPRSLTGLAIGMAIVGLVAGISALFGTALIALRITICACLSELVIVTVRKTCSAYCAD